LARLADQRLDVASREEEDWDNVRSVMLKGIPSRCTKEKLRQAIEELGFGDSCTFFYLPTKPCQAPKSEQNKGYAFVGFEDHATTISFRDAIVGYRFNRISEKVISVHPARLQGAAQFEHFRHSKVLNSKFAPIFKDGLPSTNSSQRIATLGQDMPGRSSSTLGSILEPVLTILVKYAHSNDYTIDFIIQQRRWHLRDEVRVSALQALGEYRNAGALSVISDGFEANVQFVEAELVRMGHLVLVQPSYFVAVPFLAGEPYAANTSAWGEQPFSGM
jgi:hypothetical protein